MKESKIEKSLEDKPDYDVLINKHLKVKEQSYIPLVFIGLVLLILIIGGIYLLSKSAGSNTGNTGTMPVVSGVVISPVSTPQYADLQNLASQNQTQVVQQNSEVTTKDYTITNKDGNTVTLKYPSTWIVKTFNDNATFAFIAPDGSALGYDFAQYTGIQPCQSNSKVIADGRMSRYYDATSNAGVNWYVCDFDQANNVFYVNNYDLFTVYAINDSDLVTIDEILTTVVRSKPASAVYIGRAFNASFEYPQEFGRAKNHTSEYLLNNVNECTTETVTFANSDISILIQTGFPECIGSLGNITDTLTSRDGKTFYVSTDKFQDNPNQYTIVSKFGTGGHPAWGMNINVGGTKQNVNDNNKNALTNQIKFITQSSVFDISGLKSTSFDEIQHN